MNTQFPLLMAMLVPCAAVSAGDTQQKPPEGAARHTVHLTDTFGLGTALTGNSTTDLWGDHLASWARSDVYQKVSAIDLLLEHLADPTQVTTLNHQPARGTHNLNVVAGRAASAIEAIYKVRLTPVGRAPTDAELGAVWKQADVLLAAYREGAVALADELASAKSSDEIRRAFAGRLVPRTMANAAAQAEAMEQFLRAWFPIGKRLTDLEAVAGPPNRKEGDRWEYSYDTGYDGVIFTVRHAGGRIKAVTTRGIY